MSGEITPEQWGTINALFDKLTARLDALEASMGAHAAAKVGQSHDPRVPAGPPRLEVVANG